MMNNNGRIIYENVVRNLFFFFCNKNSDRCIRYSTIAIKKYSWKSMIRESYICQIPIFIISYKKFQIFLYVWCVHNIIIWLTGVEGHRTVDFNRLRDYRYTIKVSHEFSKVFTRLHDYIINTPIRDKLYNIM